MTRPAPWRLADVQPAPRSTEKPDRMCHRTRAIRRALVGHVRFEAVTSSFLGASDAIVTTVVPVARDVPALRQAAEVAVSRVPWIDSALVNEDERVVELLSLQAIR